MPRNFLPAVTPRVAPGRRTDLLYRKELLFRRIPGASPHECPDLTAAAGTRYSQAPDGLMIVQFLLHTCNRKISDKLSCRRRRPEWLGLIG